MLKYINYADMRSYNRMIKYLYKSLFWNLCSFHSYINKEKDIFIMTTGRSGGTWLTEMIGASKGVRFCQEPLSYSLIYHPRINAMKNLARGELFVEDEEYLALLLEYIEDIQKGNLKIQHPWRINRPYFHLRTNRTVFKLARALYLTGFFHQNFSGYFLYYLRHPFSVALSWKKNKFSYNVSGFLQSKQFLNKYFTSGQISRAFEVADNGDPLEKFVLRWIFENIVPLSFLSENEDKKNFYILIYEHLVTKPYDVLSSLSDTFNLEKSSLIDYLSTSSNTTGRKFKKDLYGKNSPLISRWEDNLSNSQQDKLFTLLEELGIEVYKRGKYLPDLGNKFHKYIL